MAVEQTKLQLTEQYIYGTFFQLLRNIMLPNTTKKRRFNDLRYSVIQDAHILIWDADPIH